MLNAPLGHWPSFRGAAQSRLPPDSSRSILAPQQASLEAWLSGHCTWKASTAVHTGAPLPGSTFPQVPPLAPLHPHAGLRPPCTGLFTPKVSQSGVGTESHATSRDSLTWLEGRGWLSSMVNAGPEKVDVAGTSSGKLEKDHFRTGLESQEHRSHRLPREDREPFQCQMLSGTVSLGVQAARGACDTSGTWLGGTE